MKRRFASIAGTVWCVTLVVVACGGSDFEGPSGDAAGATSAGSPSAEAGGEPSAGTGGKTSGGTASGGTATGGKSGSGGGGSNSGGSATGGTASGGTATGGTASGGTASGGTASGGTASGGTAGSGGGNADPSRCETDSDCVDCAYPTAPQNAADCYCASCANTPLSKAACATNHEAWTKSCGGTPRICPAIACITPPVPKCKSHMCVAG